MGSDGQRTSQFNRRNHTAGGARARRARNAAGGRSQPRANAPAAASSNFLPRPCATATPGWHTRAVKRFFDWCEDHRLGLEEIEPIAIAADIEELGSEIARPSVKRHLAAIRQLFDYLVTGGILLSTPAGPVRGPKYVVTRGKTPVPSGGEMRQLLKSIDASGLIGLRDRALLGLMGYTFARVSAVITLRVEDYFQQGRRSCKLCFSSKFDRLERTCAAPMFFNSIGQHSRQQNEPQQQKEEPRVVSPQMGRRRHKPVTIAVNSSTPRHLEVHWMRGLNPVKGSARRAEKPWPEV